MLFPLITFPYVSRILGVDNIGRYNYINSIISYFVLFSGLGINSYAIREGAALRENRAKLEHFASEMFTINILSTLVSYLVLAVVCFAFNGLEVYRTLLVVLSIQIILKTVGVEWVYSIFEDYLYITVRSIAFQVLSLVLLFVCVHTENDLNIYAGITVVALAGSNILNWVHSRKRIRIGFTSQISWKSHLRPIFVLFAMSLTVSIYVSSDTTILGILCGDKTVGIYSVSTKIYTVVKTILSTVLVVSIPRLSSQFGTGRMEEFRETANDIYRTLITVMLPAITGLIILSKPIVLLVSGPAYEDAASSLSILGIALFFCMAAWFWGQCILVPMKMENEVFKVTLFSAILNLVLNFLLIPHWRENAAAFTTALAEGCAFCWSIYQGKRASGVSGEGKTYLKVGVGCIGIVFVTSLVGRLVPDGTVQILVAIVVSAIVYGGIEVAVRNETIYSLLRGIRAKIKSRARMKGASNFWK